MKKLRMIVTSVIVLAIVGSAFAFRAKRVGIFCVDTDGDGICDAILSNRYVVVSGGIPFLYYTNWSGKIFECIGQRCPTAVRLSIND